MNTSLDYSRIGDEVSIGLTEYVPTGRRLKISALGIDTASSSVQKYSKVDDMLTLLSGNIGTYSMSGLDTDKYTDGQQSIQNIISANIGQEYMILSSSSSLSLYKGTYVKGAMSLNLATMYVKPGITALNITPAEEDSAIGSGTHPWPDIYADRINGIDYGTGTLGTTSQNIIGAINELHSACVVSTYYNSSTGSWYRKYSDGWIEQGGLIKSCGTCSSGGTTITFPKAFSIRVYLVQATAYQKGGETYSCHAYIGTYTTTTCQFVSSINGKVQATRDVFWYVCGF